jgi:hypothetical protein
LTRGIGRAADGDTADNEPRYAADIGKRYCVAFSHENDFEADIDRRDSLKRGAMLSASRRRKNSLLENQASVAPETGQCDRPAVQALHAPPPDRPSTVLALIERVALDPCADVEKLERLMAMYERLKAKKAEFAYNAAKGRILKKLAGINIAKNRSGLHETEKGKPEKGRRV